MGSVRPSRVFLLAFVAIASALAGWSLHDNERRTAVLASTRLVQDPTPTPLTEQQRLEVVIEQLRLCGAMLPPDSLNSNINIRRSTYQQMLCYLAFHLASTNDPAFAGVISAACEAQRNQWPEQVEFCQPCWR